MSQQAIRRVLIRGRVQGVGYRAWVEYAALDRGLASAERWAGFLDDLCALPGCVLRGPRRRRRRREEEAEAA